MYQQVLYHVPSLWWGPLRRLSRSCTGGLGFFLQSNTASSLSKEFMDIQASAVAVERVSLASIEVRKSWRWRAQEGVDQVDKWL